MSKIFRVSTLKASMNLKTALYIKNLSILEPTRALFVFTPMVLDRALYQNAKQYWATFSINSLDTG